MLTPPPPPYAQGYTGKDGNKLANSGGNPLAAPVVAGTLALPFVFIISLFLIAPGTQTPFSFLDGFYAPRGAEMKAIKVKNEKIEEEAKAAKAKAAAEAAEKEAAAAAEAAKAAATKK